MKKTIKNIIIILSGLCLSALLVAATQRLNTSGTYIREDGSYCYFLVIKKDSTIRCGGCEGKLIQEDGQYYIEYETKYLEFMDDNHTKWNTYSEKRKIEFVDGGLILSNIDESNGFITSSYLYQKLK